jgi:hypothetical protein
MSRICDNKWTHVCEVVQIVALCAQETMAYGQL